jgi:NitT/TauT family transport system permease protein
MSARVAPARTAGLAAWRRFGTARALRWAILAATFGVLELLTRAGTIEPLILPPPTDIVRALVDLVQTSQFAQDLTRTCLTVAISFAIGLVAGVALGVACWRLPLFGNVLEPYLVTLYAMPTLVFYPVLLALMGVGMGPIVVIASLMVTIPIALNTMVALRSVSPVLPKLARSVNCTRSQRYRKVLLPAATPLAVPGVKLGVIYAIIGTVAMEFILADRGMGYRIGVDYREFDVAEMWALIVAISVLAITVTSAVGVLERRIRRDML